MSTQSPQNTIDKMEKYCAAHGVAAARQAANELWVFAKGSTPRGARLFTHRFRLETDRLLSVESGIALPMDITAQTTKKSRSKTTAKFSAADEKFKYPAMTRLFRGAAATLTDALIGDNIAATTKNAEHIVSLVLWRQESQRQVRAAAKKGSLRKRGRKAA